MSYLVRYWDRVLGLVGEHLLLTLATLAIALALALPTGLLLARVRPLRGPVLGLLGVVYTVPSLALFALLIPVTGLGSASALIALVAYCQLVLVRNVVVGLDGVDPSVIEAARGMGMGAWRRLADVEAPLALPVVLAGVRVALVSTIGIATLAAWINAGGLGVLLFEGLYQDHTAKILVGTSAVSALAIGANVLIGRLERLAWAWAGGRTPPRSEQQPQ
ncbi:MAG TPA: ABC transporter permease [Thermodesulfobacteriota bacterium]